MTTITPVEALYNSQGISDNPYDPTTSTLSTGSGFSLAQDKQNKVASISEAKKFSLDPSIIPSDALRVLDGDTVHNNLTDTRIRLDQADNGSSFNAFETRKDFVKPSAENDARMLKQRQAIADDAHLPLDYIPNEAVYRRGQEGVDKLKQVLKDAQNVSVNSGKTDVYGRTVADLNNPVTGASLLAQLNTPELNSNYHSKYNIVTEGEDLLKEAARRQEATKYSVSDESRETFLGGIANAIAAGLTRAGDIVADTVKAPFELAEQVREHGITNEQRNTYNSVKAKQEAADKAGTTYTPTAEEQAILETTQSPLQSYTQNLASPFLKDGMINGKDLLLAIAGNFPNPLDVKQKLAVSETMQKNITDNVTMAQENFRKIYNSSGSDQLYKDAIALYKGSVEPTFYEGVAKVKQGNELEGTLQVADAIANAGVGIFRVGANNPQAVAEEVVKMIPNAYAASKQALAMFLGLYTDNAAKAQTVFVKEHGRFPEGTEVDRLQLDSAGAAIMDTFADRAIVSKPGALRAFGREGATEAGQNIAEQDAGKQDLSKIDFAEAYANGVIGSLAGHGTSVALHPVESIKGDAKDVIDVVKTVGNTASVLVPESVKTAVQDTAQTSATTASDFKHTVSSAATAAKEAVTTAADEVTSATTTPTVDPIQQSAQIEDHVEALKTLLRPENIAAVRTSSEGIKPLVDEASRRNGELYKELFALSSLEEPTKENDARLKQLLPYLRNNTETLDALKLELKGEDTTEADIALATSVAEQPEIAEQPATIQAVERTINSMRQPGKIGKLEPEQLQAYENFAKNAPLTPEQSAVATAFVNTRKALATMKDVREAVIYGEGDYIGMFEHQEMVADFLSQGNTPVAKSALDGFRAFTASQTKKATLLTGIAKALASGNTEEVTNLKQQYAKAFPSSKNKGILNTDSEVAFNSLVSTVNQEADLLKAAYTESELHFNLATKKGSQASTTIPTEPEQQTNTAQLIVSTVPASTATQPMITRADAIKYIQTNWGLLKDDWNAPQILKELNDSASEIGVINANNFIPHWKSLYSSSMGTGQRSKTPQQVPVLQTLESIAAANEVTTDDSQEQGQTSSETVNTTQQNQEQTNEKSIQQTDPQAVSGAVTEQESTTRPVSEESAPVDPDKVNATEVVITETEDEVPPESVDTTSAEEVNTEEDIIETKDPVVELIRDLARRKEYSKYPLLREAVASILEGNSTKGYSAFRVTEIIKSLQAKPDKFSPNDTTKETLEDVRTLGEQSLDSLREFKTGKTLRDYYSAMKLNAKVTYSVLQTVPNFFSKLRGKDFRDSLGLSDKQHEGLSALDIFVTEFTKTFKEATFDGSKVGFASNVIRDPSYYFMKEEGRDFDENFISTLAVVAYSWIVNGANDTLTPDDATINARLGRDSKHEVTTTERELLFDKGVFKTALIENLGKEVISSLGLKFNPKADGAVESKMPMALGTHIINTLDHMGIIEESKSLHPDVVGAMKRGEEVSEADLNKSITDRDVVYFVRAANKAVDNKAGTYSLTVLNDRVQNIVDAVKDNDKLLTKLFGSTKERDLPSLTPPELINVPKIIKRGIKRIPERVRKALHKYSSNPFTINLDNHDVLDFLEEDQQLELLEYNETYEGVHAINKKSVEGLNRSIKSEWEAYRKLIAHLKEQPEGLKTPMYFMSSVWKSGRAGMEGLINPQSSKFHRHMLGMSAWESTIDSPEKLVLFKKAVAEAFDEKIGSQSDAVTLEAFDKLMASEVVKDGIVAIKWLRTNPEMSAEDKLATQQTILDAVKAGKHKTLTLEALTALVNYSKDKPFKTRMTIEVDGVTNGIIIGLIQLMGADPEQMKELLKSGALSQDPNFVYGEFISKLGSVDNYQRMAYTLVENKKTFYEQVNAVFTGTTSRKQATESVEDFIKVGGNVDTLSGIDFFVGNLVDGANLTREARELAKHPLLTTSFGAALVSVIDGLGVKVLKNFYSKLEKNRDSEAELKQIAVQLNKILKPEKPYEITIKNALTFKLNTEESKRFKKLVSLSVGTSMGEAIKQHFQTFMAKRAEINNAMNLVHTAFILKYDKAYKDAVLVKNAVRIEEEIAALKEQGIEPSAKQLAEIKERNIQLSNEEIDAIVKKLEPSMASFDHAMSDGQMGTELFVATNDTERKFPKSKDDKEAEAFKVQVTSKRPLQHGKSSVSSYGSVRVFAMPGVGSAIKAIHSSDGTVQYKLMENHAVLNVHDANVVGIGGAMAMVLGQNQAFKEVMEEYSMRAAVQKTLLRAMNALTPEERKQVDAILRITDKKDPKFLGNSFVKQGQGKEPKYNTIREFVDEFKATTVLDLKAKRELVASIRSWGQYNFNHGAYVISDEVNDLLEIFRDLESSVEREDELINSMVAEEIKYMEASLAREAGITLKSSATETIDTKTFVPDMAMTVAPETVVTIFDQLGKEGNVRDSVEHTEHLRDLLNISIKDVLKPFELMVRKLGQTNSGVLEQGNIYLNVGNNNRIYTTDQSAQEVYAHEVVHHVTVAGLTTDYWLRKRVNNLFNKVKEQITPESFLDYDASGNVIVPAGSTLTEAKAKAKALHDHIFDNNDITVTKYRNPITNEIITHELNNGLFEFVAMGRTNAKFLEVLKGIDLSKSKKARVTVADKVFGLFTDILQSVLNVLDKVKDPSANTALMVLMHKLARTNKAKSNFLVRKLEENGQLEEILNSKLYKVIAYSALTSSKLLKKTGNKALVSVGEIIGLGPETDFEVYKRVVGKVARKMKITEKAFAYQLFNEMEGITAAKAKYHHLLAKSNMFIDQLRRLMARNLANYITKSFVAGKPSKSESKAITKVMLKTDMGHLIDSGYSWDRVLELLKADNKLAKEIADIEKLLQAEAPDNFDYYKTQAASLGHMMVYGQPLKWGTKYNAVQITHLGGTGKTLQGDLEAIEKHLDTLASLRALEYMNQDELLMDHVTNFVTVTEREFVKDKDNNGILMTYLVHKDLKERALVESFGGQRELMIKGYTKEIYNPRVTVITAPGSMEAVLKARGYVKHNTFTQNEKDPTDLNDVPISVYVNRDGDTATYMKMIVSLTSNKAKGPDLTAGYSSIGELNPALLGAFNVAHATHTGQAIINHPDYSDLSKKGGVNLLVPIENPNHEVVGYRYLMAESTKDYVLEKDNSFDKVLGAMEASIVDKRESKKINNEVVKLMKDDFDANYVKTPDLFIKFGPNVMDKEYREKYALLPKDMRREIRRVWRGDDMYVRADVFKTIFGFRKFTLTEESKEKDEMEAMHQSVLAKFGSGLRNKLRTPTAKKLEIGLQEIAKEVKDAIVIKSGSTLYNNVKSNNWLLWLNGLSRVEIIKDQAIALDATRQYQKDHEELLDLERSIRINPRLQNSTNVKARIKHLKDSMAVNPVAPLIESGLFQTIVEDIDPDESQYTYKGLIEAKLAPAVARVPKPLRNLASVAYMTHDTKLYKFMHEATQLSDFVARYALHKHNVEKKGMSFEASVNNISEVFINYDLPTSKELQYLNDMNFLMFTKFFLRSQKIIAQTYRKAPARMLGLLGIENVLGEISSIDDGNIITTSAIGRLSNPLGLIDEVVVPHTPSLFDPTSIGGGTFYAGE